MKSSEKFVSIFVGGNKKVAFIPVKDGTSMRAVFEEDHRLFGTKAGWPMCPPSNLGMPIILGALGRA